MQKNVPFFYLPFPPWFLLGANSEATKGIEETVTQKRERLMEKYTWQMAAATVNITAYYFNILVFVAMLMNIVVVVAVVVLVVVVVVLVEQYVQNSVYDNSVPTFKDILITSM
uniref:Uncharacterized protein n=1 Tax=Glossina pallidipes TaxID=7398 RepID=A0A1A9Z9V9_GLOPL